MDAALIADSPIPELSLDSWEDYLKSLDGNESSPSNNGEGATSQYAQTAGVMRSGVHRSEWKVLERFTAYDGGPELVVLPPGKFMMGAHPQDRDASFDENPRHAVEIKQAFAIGILPITFEQWDAAVADGGVRHQPEDATWGRGQRPVVNVSWHDTEEYLGWLKRKTGLDFRLPTESEWEYACWAGSPQATRYPWGDDLGERQLEHYAWFFANSNNRSQPVGQKPANDWGLCDMLGNVQEWMQDHYRHNYDELPADQAPWLSTRRSASRVLRGGSWLDSPRAVRPTARQRWQPDHRSYNSGFRIALTVNLATDTP